MLNISENIPSLPLTKLLPNNDLVLHTDPLIHGVTCDSRQVKNGFLFFALKGSTADGNHFIPKALEQGAVAVVSETPLSLSKQYPSVTFIQSPDPRQWYSLAAKHFYQKTPQQLVAVTGTNGKTSVTHFCRQLWLAAGFQSASLGTVGVYKNNQPLIDKNGTSLTTPDPADFYRILRQLADDGISHAAFEASSHGLDQYRFSGEGIKAGAFTNLTRDHLDYHQTMAAYFQAKSLLFSKYLENGSLAVLNRDCEVFEALNQICQEKHHRIISFGKMNADVQLDKATPTPHGFDLELSVFGKRHHIELPLVGRFQIENMLCSLALVLGLGDVPENIVESCSTLISVPGRMQHIASTRPYSIFVDYAHTPDALEKALQALEPHTTGSINLVFGCGGDRDPGKRPLMGEVAKRFAQRITVTDDNPRTENPDHIREQIMTAVPHAANIANREEAIAHAIAQMQSGDTLLIAGKGHENYQIIGHTSYPFDDVAVANNILHEREVY